jgi:UDP-glucuronate 4-epimerase
MKILVTGAAGFVGFHLCRRICGNGDEVVGIDSISDYYDPALKYARLSELGIPRAAADYHDPAPSTRLNGFTFRRLSLEDRAAMGQLFADSPFERVFHLAAQAGVRYSIENPHAYIQANVEGFLNILEGCRAAKTHHLVFASSSSVYGLSQRRPFSEHDVADHPLSLYAATKKSNELMAHAYSHLFGIPCTGLRFFTVYGPWGRPDMAYFKFAQAIDGGRPIELYNRGEMTRDFTYIDDAVEGLVNVMDHPPCANPDWDSTNPDPASSSAPFRLYNMGNGKPEPLASLVAALESSLGKKAQVRLLPLQPGDVTATQADLAGLEADLGWRPATSLEDGIASFVEWFKEYGRGRT